MNPRMLLVPAVALFAISLASCGSKSASTYGGGGGGTTTGPTIDLTFPAQGTSRSFTFTDAGSWIYHCAAHGTQNSGMRGTVVVDASASADSDTVAVGVNGSGTPTLTFTPISVTIKPGGHVRWINRSSMTNHTVTRP